MQLPAHRKIAELTNSVFMREIIENGLQLNEVKTDEG
jgi:hypothetical protein